MNYKLLFSITCFPPLLAAQSNLVVNGAYLKVASGTDLRVEQGSIRNDNAATINNSGRIYLDRNFNQQNASNYIGDATSWLWFEGVGTQTINAASVARLRVEPGRLLQLQNTLSVSTDIDLMNGGDIELGNFNLLADNANISNYGVSAYIITNGTGYLQRLMNSGDVKTFPVGNSSYNPALLTNTGVSDLFQMRVADIVYSGGLIGSGVPEVTDIVNRTWLITETVPGGSVCDMVLEWDQAEELTTFDRTQSGIAHWDVTWEHPLNFTAATNVGGTRWSQTRTGQTTFSPFVVEDIRKELPIELMSFEAHRTSADWVKLNWATASELNNAGFDIERMLDNESDFAVVGFVEGYGTSIQTIQYAFNDPNPHPGISYYRLRQRDFDGTISYSDVRAVSGKDLLQGDPIRLYPNPSRDVVNIRFGDLSDQQTSALVRVLDMRGALLQEFEVGVAAYQSFSIDAADFAAGAYQVILLLNTGEQQVLRFVRE